MPKFFQAFLNSLAGIRYAFGDRSFRNTFIQFILGLIIASWLTYDYHLHPYIWLLLVASLFPMVIIEAVNTSIEAVTDKASPERSLLAKKAKDIGSAAVLLSRILAIICWIVAFTVHA